MHRRCSHANKQLINFVRGLCSLHPYIYGKIFINVDMPLKYKGHCTPYFNFKEFFLFLLPPRSRHAWPRQTIDNDVAMIVRKTEVIHVALSAPCLGIFFFSKFEDSKDKKEDSA